ncbi:MAG TPA: hypothetical protein VFU23_16845 [Gemmatimonadales bacterium]|nr:hypothetical protein [Gemmatimonadales bacterium]
MRAPFRALVPLMLLTTAGCTQVFDSTTLGVPVSMSAAPGDVPAGKPFKVSGHTVHGLFGLITFSQANLRKGLATELVGADQVANLKIRTKSRWFDIVITGITLGLVVPRTVTYEGVVIGR